MLNAEVVGSSHIAQLHLSPYTNVKYPQHLHSSNEVCDARREASIPATYCLGKPRMVTRVVLAD